MPLCEINAHRGTEARCFFALSGQYFENAETGYRVIVDGQQLVFGGTSAVAPLMAALVARLNQQKGKPLGFFHPKLYNGSFRYLDIIHGDNKTTFSRKGFEAGPGVVSDLQ